MVLIVRILNNVSNFNNIYQQQTKVGQCICLSLSVQLVFAVFCRDCVSVRYQKSLDNYRVFWRLLVRTVRRGAKIHRKSL